MSEPLAPGTMTQAQLLALARSLGLEPPKNAPRAKLIRAIRDKRRSLKAEQEESES
jgi:hypothetical protein